MVRTQLNARVPGVPRTLSLRKWTKAVGEVVVCVHATHRNYYTVCYTVYLPTQHNYTVSCYTTYYTRQKLIAVTVRSGCGTIEIVPPYF